MGKEKDNSYNLVAEDFISYVDSYYVRKSRTPEILETNTLLQIDFATSSAKASYYPKKTKIVTPEKEEMTPFFEDPVIANIANFMIKTELDVIPYQEKTFRLVAGYFSRFSGDKEFFTKVLISSNFSSNFKKTFTQYIWRNYEKDSHIKAQKRREAFSQVMADYLNFRNMYLILKDYSVATKNINIAKLFEEAKELSASYTSEYFASFKPGDGPDDGSSKKTKEKEEVKVTNIVAETSHALQTSINISRNALNYKRPPLRLVTSNCYQEGQFERTLIDINYQDYLLGRLEQVSRTGDSDKLANLIDEIQLGLSDKAIHRNYSHSSEAKRSNK